MRDTNNILYFGNLLDVANDHQSMFEIESFQSLNFEQPLSLLAFQMSLFTHSENKQC